VRLADELGFGAGVDVAVLGVDVVAGLAGAAEAGAIVAAGVALAGEDLAGEAAAGVGVEDAAIAGTELAAGMALEPAFRAPDPVAVRVLVVADREPLAAALVAVLVALLAVLVTVLVALPATLVADCVAFLVALTTGFALTELNEPFSWPWPLKVPAPPMLRPLNPPRPPFMPPPKPPPPPRMPAYAPEVRAIAAAPMPAIIVLLFMSCSKVTADIPGSSLEIRRS
jgi:hypothetical protein